jgi:hypothetical protein
MRCALGLQGANWDDDEAFREQVCISGFCDQGSAMEKSTVRFSGGLLLEGGLHHTLMGVTTLGASVGYSFLSDPTRGIATCDNCREEEISMKGGPYVRPEVWVHAGPVGMSYSYSKYLAGPHQDGGMSVGLTLIIR